MIFEETGLPGLCVVRLDRHADDRGFFARAFCREEFGEHGLMTGVAQANISRSRHAGTLRGMHFQAPPAAEAKLVRCTRGALFDVGLDLRPGSPTYGRWFGIELRADEHTMLHVPEGFAHGFQTLTDDAEAFYQVSHPYAPEQERGIRFDDPQFGIEWPRPVRVISDKDAAWPDYEPDPALEALAIGRGEA